MNGFLAYRRRPPAEPSAREIDFARRWLARRGVAVSLPTRLLCIRIGAHSVAPSAWLRTVAIYAVLAVGGAVGYQSLQELPGVHGREMTSAVTLFFVIAGLQVGWWRARRLRERNLAASVPHRLIGVARPKGVVDGWFGATAATTFAGGAFLALAVFAAVPEARTWAWSWLGLLAVGAICTGVIVVATSREPVLAEDDASLAAGELLRREAVQATAPAMYTLPVLFEVFGEGRQPPAFTGLLIGYVVLCLALQSAGPIALSRRKLPPGHYGEPETAAALTADDDVWRPVVRG
ncbi:hypothetical protein AB0K15_07150 [Amycolatopsis sp. NPDC049253]|uniref:hypothetical protein n=1 Tax=Amycolatopsis sp. NPDC049253 TaxID=3155274 RepID=UPI003428FD16